MLYQDMAWSGVPLAVLSVVLLAIFRHVTGSFPLLCGQELVNAVATVCNERGYYGQPSKRSANIFELETRAKTFLKSGITRGERHRSKRRVRTGLIVTECCLNRCSVSHLESYCNPLPEGAEHDPAIHIRPEKSAEEDPDEAQARPQDGQSELDTATGAAPETGTSETRGRGRVDAVEEVLSNRLIPTSAAGSSPTPSRKKPRKDKSERRNSSREAKQARREERRRNRERSSGGRSRSGRRKNKDNDRASRAKRNGLSLWNNMFSNENFRHIPFPDLESQQDLQRVKERASSPFSASTLEMETPIPVQHGNEKDKVKTNSIKQDEDKSMRFSALMTKLRTLVLNYPNDR